MELDIFVPSLSLGFEYQGEHHYSWTTLFGDPSEFMNKDNLKRDACKAAGITLIEIPYWWDYDKSSIIATIHQERPDIIKDPGSGKPIPPLPTVKR